MNLTKYFERIKFDRAPQNNESTLFDLQASQVTSIPFETIDCLHHRTIHTDIENLKRKIVTNQRGGYCFELNGIFQHALLSLNFKSRPLLARAMYRGTEINSRTHMILLVEINGKEFIADAGFGGPGAYLPIPFEIDREDIQSHGTFRITRDHTHCLIMQKQTDEGWFNVYAFNLDTVYPSDLVMSNFFTSQFPESRFRKNLIMALHRPDGRITLLNRQLTTVINKKSTTEEIANVNELLLTIKNKFGVKLEDGFDFSRFF